MLTCVLASLSPAQTLPKVWAGEILIAFEDKGKGRTQATVTYRRTALSPEADQAIEAFGRHFPEQHDHWQNAINERLQVLAEQHEDN